MFPPAPFVNMINKLSETVFSGADDTHDDRDDERCEPKLLDIIMGMDRDQCNGTMMQYHWQSTSSVRSILQYGQETKSGNNYSLMEQCLIFY